jgi:hypothetical protein
VRVALARSDTMKWKTTRVVGFVRIVICGLRIINGYAVETRIMMMVYKDVTEGNERRKIYQKALYILKFNHYDEFARIFKKLMRKNGIIK